MEWSEHYKLWARAEAGSDPAAHLHIEAARRRVRDNTRADWAWLSSALGDPQRKVFVALVFQRQPVPEHLLPALLQAGVVERNPSLNRIFIEPCVRSAGVQQINQRLLQYLREGTNEEKAGAASALYWALGSAREDELGELLAEVRCALLREFVHNADTRVRQRIVPMLNLDADSYAPTDRHLVQDAISLARAHPDEYIRHRIEVQLGASGLLGPLPDT
jgi:hypothetical protein